ncbi:MarR family transcriptional regulator [Acidianus sulfidivorans JP7]|uniref:MarR family transcriptional regulator n=1 Tax=Acidianus sulfidivorans JP7 TaxID=619593 RepID=A0A2U9IN43_9CREN|nr:MarR family transcriptional regulator [Acidianus sulfidivorans]AWR97431.1 MarR family transcriptional regulator [Acidianus sulfidivorans JP7]
MNVKDKILALLYDRGELTDEEIASTLREDVEDIQLFLKGMEREGLVTEKQKGLIFKKKVYQLTPTGLEKAKNIKEDLQNKANKLMEAIQNGEDPQIIYEEFGDILPLMMAMSLIDMMMLQSMLMFDFTNFM